jgi:hypothetical protein
MHAAACGRHEVLEVNLKAARVRQAEKDVTSGAAQHTSHVTSRVTRHTCTVRPSMQRMVILEELRGGGQHDAAE